MWQFWIFISYLAGGVGMYAAYEFSLSPLIQAVMVSAVYISIAVPYYITVISDDK